MEPLSISSSASHFHSEMQVPQSREQKLQQLSDYYTNQQEKFKARSRQGQQRNAKSGGIGTHNYWTRGPQSDVLKQKGDFLKKNKQNSPFFGQASNESHSASSKENLEQSRLPTEVLRCDGDSAGQSRSRSPPKLNEATRKTLRRKLRKIATVQAAKDDAIRVREYRDIWDAIKSKAGTTRSSQKAYIPIHER